MGLDFEFVTMGEILQVSISGSVEKVKQVLDMIDRTSEKASSLNIKKVMFYFKDLTASTTEIDLFEIGNYISIKLNYLIKFAAVAPPGLIEDRKFVAMVAENRGVKSKVFTDRDSALEWLAK